MDAGQLKKQSSVSSNFASLSSRILKTYIPLYMCFTLRVEFFFICEPNYVKKGNFQNCVHKYFKIKLLSHSFGCI